MNGQHWLVSAIRGGLALLIATAGSIMVASGLAWLVRSPMPAEPRFGKGFKPTVTGLTEAEAEIRQTKVDQVAMVRAEEKRFLRQAIRRNIFSIVNIDLFAIGVIMLLLGSPLNMFGSFVVLILNTALNVFQEVYSKRNLDRLMQSVRPQATVIRDGQLRSIIPEDVVTGDMVVVSAGDQVLVNGQIVGDGQIVVDESVADSLAREKGPGDRLTIGSVCLNGRAIYRASRKPAEARGAESGVQVLPSQKTPLQELINNVLRALFVLVIIFSVLLVLDSIIDDRELVSEFYRDAFGLVFAIAPTSLFFILVVHYAVGSLRMSDFGALFYQSRSIEALSNVSVLCLSWGSVLGSLQISVEPLPIADEQEPLAEPLVRHMLGDVVNSLPVANQLLADTLPGEDREVVEIAPYMSLYGWHGVTFDDDDRRGTFILGDPAVLGDYLQRPKTDVLAEVGQTLSEAGRWLRRSSEDDRLELDDDSTASPVEAQSDTDENGETAGGEEAPNFWLRLGQRLLPVVSPLDGPAVVPEGPADPSERLTLLFAYLPQVLPLASADGRPQLPLGLVEVANVQIAEGIAPGAQETIQSIRQAGVEVKLLASAPPEQVAVTAAALGLGNGQPRPVQGEHLAQMAAAEYEAVVRDAAAFANLTPSQKQKILVTLQRQEQYVAMIGDSANDLPALAQSNLAIALKSGSQAVLEKSDVVMLKDSLDALPLVVKTGQRLVNGVLDTFKLYLSQVSTQLFLVLMVFLLNLREFPYHPTQGSVISLFTIAIPNILLPFWSSTGKMTRERMLRRLAHFVVPYAVTTGILALVVFWYFERNDGDLTYSWLVVTFAMLGAGWLRLLFVQPPSKFWVAGDVLAGDRRVYWLVVGTMTVFAVIVSIPLFQGWLRINYLRSATDYLLVTAAVIVWALVLRLVWRALLLNRLVEFVSERFEDDA